MSKCIISGSFDPITNGHVDLIERAAAHFDTVVVAIGDNIAKQAIPAEERARLIKKVFENNSNIEAVVFRGLLAKYAILNGISVIVKGIRDRDDLKYEADMARANREISGVETFFLLCNDKYQHVSSSFVKELIAFDGDISDYVPQVIKSEVLRLYKKN
ncbi:MAG: pantetheine-phosphate adenylyltransferase [Clostridia bacterium]|nr:pantetheine-phosphate adenylyltransferase [Clostridia bacterium]